MARAISTPIMRLFIGLAFSKKVFPALDHLIKFHRDFFSRSKTTMGKISSGGGFKDAFDDAGNTVWSVSKPMFIELIVQTINTRGEDGATCRACFRSDQTERFPSGRDGNQFSIGQERIGGFKRWADLNVFHVIREHAQMVDLWTLASDLEFGDMRWYPLHSFYEKIKALLFVKAPKRPDF